MPNHDEDDDAALYLASLPNEAFRPKFVPNKFPERQFLSNWSESDESLAEKSIPVLPVPGEDTEEPC